jgi:hypothetical protein
VRYVCPSEAGYKHSLIFLAALAVSITCFRGVGVVGGEADPVLPTPAIDQEETQVEATDKADQEVKV